uniref:Uncharacterized protein LOC104246064 n=1 Tax=Nicotiana sylvestris TaxID=4096 RepID=A0A1U7Y7J6_NICSY|nr:PREDICTED: uncharacterized protein LOC104246064 [Nicotiana sylvestris]
MSVAYKDLCLFPDIQLLAGFKMSKFDLYDGHRDPVAHLSGKMRGVGGKDILLMEYFSQSLSGVALEWYTGEDASRWNTWDDMAQVSLRMSKSQSAHLNIEVESGHHGENNNLVPSNEVPPVDRNEVLAVNPINANSQVAIDATC